MGSPNKLCEMPLGVSNERGGGGWAYVQNIIQRKTLKKFGGLEKGPQIAISHFFENRP